MALKFYKTKLSLWKNCLVKVVAYKNYSLDKKKKKRKVLQDDKTYEHGVYFCCIIKLRHTG